MRKNHKIAALTVLLLISLFLFTAGYLFFGKKSLQNHTPDPEGSRWMASLEEEVMLNAVTLPGTHDSCAWNSDFAYFSQCQNSDIITQLQMGVRYLDIRISLNKDGTDLIMTHSIAVCREGGRPLGKVLILDKVLEDCYRFLQENSSETIVFCVKPEEEPAECFELLQNKIQNQSQRWYLLNEIPELQEVRGKLVLASRFGKRGENSGLMLTWEDQGDSSPVKDPFTVTDLESGGSLYVQDRYSYNALDKWDAIVSGMNGKTQSIDWTRDILLQFLSTKGTRALGHPLRYAQIINQRFLEMEQQSESLGWIIVDFAEPEIIRHIYRSNYRHEPVLNREQ